MSARARLALAVGVLAFPTAATVAAGSSSAAVPPIAGAVAAVRAELRGIPQSGLVLGSGAARVTVFEYADLVCGPCAAQAAALVPDLIRRYVRLGLIDLQFEPIVESPRSDQLAHGAYSAGLQGRGWDYIQLAYARTSARSDGPVGAPARFAAALDLDRQRWLRKLELPRWARMIEQTAKVALVGQFSAYPVFIVRGTPNLFGQRILRVLRAPVTLQQLTRVLRNAIRVADA